MHNPLSIKQQDNHGMPVYYYSCWNFMK